MRFSPQTIPFERYPCTTQCFELNTTYRASRRAASVEQALGGVRRVCMEYGVQGAKVKPTTVVNNVDDWQWMKSNAISEKNEKHWAEIKPSGLYPWPISIGYLWLL